MQVNGQKKWITGGMYADWFMTGVKTSENGLTMMLIPKTDDGEPDVRPIMHARQAEFHSDLLV